MVVLPLYVLTAVIVSLAAPDFTRPTAPPPVPVLSVSGVVIANGDRQHRTIEWQRAGVVGDHHHHGHVQFATLVAPQQVQ